MNLEKFIELDIEKFLDEKVVSIDNTKTHEEDTAILFFKKDYEKTILEAIKKGDLESARKDLTELLSIYENSDEGSKKKEIAQEILKKIYKEIIDFYKEKEKEKSIVELLGDIENKGIVKGERLSKKLISTKVDINQIEERGEKILRLIESGELERAEKSLEKLDELIEKIESMEEKDHARIISLALQSRIKEKHSTIKREEKEARERIENRKKLYSPGPLKEKEEEKLIERKERKEEKQEESKKKDREIKEEVKEEVSKKKEENEKKKGEVSIDELYLKGVKLMKQKKFEEARKIFQEVLRIDPRNLKALIRLEEIKQNGAKQ